MSIALPAQFSVGSLQINVWGLFGPEPLVLVHPINTAASVWDEVARLLIRPAIPGVPDGMAPDGSVIGRRPGLPVVALDLRGHGSSRPSGPFTVDGYVDDVLAVLGALEFTAVHLAGGSLGGSIALALAARYPERVLSVTTFGSTLGTGATDADIQAMIDELDVKGTPGYFAELAPLIVGSAYRENERVLAGIREAAGARPEAVVAAILRGAFGADIRALAGRVRARVHAVGGTEDPTCPMVMTEEIAAATGGTVTVLEGVGHLPMLEVPERVAELIAAHIKEEQPG